MGDKNPKHPLKKKKVVEKASATHHEAEVTNNATSKSKK